MATTGGFLGIGGTANTVPNYDVGVRQVDFGNSIVPPNVVQTTPNYMAPSMQSFAPSPAGGLLGAFENALAYQSQMPYNSYQFNPADISPIYPQIATPTKRFDIANTIVPEFLRVETPAEAKALAQKEAINREAAGGNTSTWGSTVADLQAENKAMKDRLDSMTQDYSDNW